jgi:hypothetical protein
VTRAGVQIGNVLALRGAGVNEAEIGYLTMNETGRIEASSN